MTTGHLVEVIAVAMTVAATLFAAGLLCVQRIGRSDQTLSFAVFLGLYALTKADWLVYLVGGYAAAPHLAGLLFPLKTLLAPAFYVYVRSVTAPSPQGLRPRDAWALSGPVMIFAIMSPFFLLSSEAKAGLLSLEYPDPALRDWAFMACKLTFVVFLGVSLAYLAAAFRLVLTHVSRLRDLLSNIEDRSLDWIRWALFVLGGAWAWYSLGEIWGISGGRPAWYPALTACFELIWIGFIAFFGLLQKPVFDPVAPASPPPEKASYARSLLEDERLAAIEARLAQAMTQSDLYSDPQLSLRRLSDRLRISEDHLSQTFSRRMGTNFFDYVNSYRVVAAQGRLAGSDDAIVTIAYDVGFNARSTFNAAFKKHAGTSPSAFRRAARPAAPTPAHEAS